MDRSPSSASLLVPIRDSLALVMSVPGLLGWGMRGNGPRHRASDDGTSQSQDPAVVTDRSPAGLRHSASGHRCGPVEAWPAKGGMG